MKKEDRQQSVIIRSVANSNNDISLNNEDSNPQALRRFGWTFALVLVVLFGLLIPFLRHGSSLGLPFAAGSPAPEWPWLIAGPLLLWSLLHPRSLSLLYRPWMKFAKIAQWVNTRIILWLLFYLLIFPIGVLLRLFGKDAMQRRFDPKAPSYFSKPDAPEREQMEKPY